MPKIFFSLFHQCLRDILMSFATTSISGRTTTIFYFFNLRHMELWHFNLGHFDIWHINLRCFEIWHLHFWYYNIWYIHHWYYDIRNSNIWYHYFWNTATTTIATMIWTTWTSFMFLIRYYTYILYNKLRLIIIKYDLM